MELSNLKIGENGLVTAISADEKLKNRLKMCNLCVGKCVKCIRHAAFGGIMLECDGVCLGLRKELARKIVVTQVQANA